MKRAIIYCRVSTDEQAEKGTSLEAQERESVAYCERAGLRVVRIFREDFTGTTLDRPELTQARAALEAGQAEAFVVHRPDRLDRSEWGINLLLLLREFKGLGVELHYSQQGRQVDLHNPLEALMQSIAGWQAGEDRNDTVKKLANGRRNRARSGHVVAMGHQAPYGYRKVQDNGRWAFRIDEVEAETVRLIFAWYTDPGGGRLSLRGIATQLGKRGILARGGAPWSHPVIRRILGNETYCGVWHFGKFGNSPDTWIAVEVPAIVDRQTWLAAQAIKRQNQERSRRNLKAEYLLHRRVVCGCCGYKMGASYNATGGTIGNQRYTCQSRAAGVTDCRFGSVRAADTDQVVWGWLDTILSDQAARRRAVEEVRAAAVTQAGPIEEELALVGKSIAAAEASLARKMADLELLTTRRAKRLKNEEIEAVEAQLDALERERGGLQGKLAAARLTDEQLNSIDALMTRAAAGLEKARRNFAHRQQLVEILDVTAKALVGEDGTKAVKASAVVGGFAEPTIHSEFRKITLLSEYLVVE